MNEAFFQNPRARKAVYGAARILIAVTDGGWDSEFLETAAVLYGKAIRNRDVDHLRLHPTTIQFAIERLRTALRQSGVTSRTGESDTSSLIELRPETTQNILLRFPHELSLLGTIMLEMELLQVSIYSDFWEVCGIVRYNSSRYSRLENSLTANYGTFKEFVNS